MNIFSNGNFFAIVLGLWLIFFLLGQYQMKQIKKKTVAIVLDHAKIYLNKYPAPNLLSFYNEIYPTWVEMVRSTAIFVPHKSELFPVPARPERLRESIHFSAEWVGAYLEKNGYKIDATTEQKQKIRAILATGQKKRPGARVKDQNPPKSEELGD